MLDYIRNEINRRQQEAAANDAQQVDDETILEYAHLFQELDELSVEGKPDEPQPEPGPVERGLSNRKMDINIPLNNYDDLELSSIEVDLNTGSVKDVPSDATVQESLYASMKTVEDFIQEASNEVFRFMRESDEHYMSRVMPVAEEKFNVYKESVMEQGLFGFNKIDLTDPRVPSKVNIDFGPVEEGSSTSFMTKVKTFFGVDENRQIDKRQLDSVNYIKQNNSFRTLGKSLATYMESMNIPFGGSSMWDNITPTRLIIPNTESQSLCVVLEYFNEITKETHYYGWTHSFEGSNEEENERLNKLAFVNESVFVNKDSYTDMITEQEKLRNYPTRFKNTEVVQEFASMRDIAKEWINKPDVQKKIDDGIRKKYIDTCKSLAHGYTPNEEEIKKYMTETKNMLQSKKIDADVILSMYAPDVFNEVLKEEEKRNKEEMFANMPANIRELMKKRNENRSVQEAAIDEFVENYIQEAITMGNDDDAAQTDAQPAQPEQPTDPTATTDPTASAEPSVDMGGVDTTDAADTPAVDPNAPTIDTNDVSDAIVNKVSEKITNDSEMTDVTDDMTVDTTSLDNSLSGDEGVEDADADINDDMADSVDDKLNELNDMGTSSMEDEDDMSSDFDSEDIENMTMDELLARGNEKLKGMTIQQFKSFLSDNDNADFQEAFFPTLGLTRKTVYKITNKTIKETLTILNSTEPLPKIIKKFKSKGKDLNKILNKSLKIKDAYKPDEQKEIRTLNQSLIALMQMIKQNGESDTAAVKRLITAYGENCKKVAAINDKYLGVVIKESDDNDADGDVYQEGLFLSPNNVRKRLSKKMTPVYIDINGLKKSAATGTPIIPRVIKMYKPKNGVKTNTHSSGQNFSTTSGRVGALGATADGIDAIGITGHSRTYGNGYTSGSSNTYEYEVETPASLNLAKLLKILDKILKKQKVQRAFTADEFVLIEKLSDQVDDFIDMIEAVIYDGGKNDATSKLFVKKINELVTLMNEIFKICDGKPPVTKRKKSENKSDDDNDDDNDSFDGDGFDETGDDSFSENKSDDSLDDNDDDSDDVTTEAYNQGLGSLQNDVKQALGTSYEIANAGWNGEFKITNKENPSLGIKVKPGQNNTVSVFEIDENGIEKLPAIKNNASLSTRRGIIDTIIEFFKKAFSNVETEASLMKELGIVITEEKED